MGKVFIHIGLPKTATTTLQTQMFPVLDQDKIKYLGVFQPRTATESVGFRLLIDAINSGNVGSARDWVIKNINADNSFLLSEECILVSECQADWRSKLKNLAKIVHGLDYELILTVREPVDALFSYYVELYSQFSRENKSFLDLAMNDPRMEIFHYAKLFSELSRRFEPNRIFVKKFEDIVLGETSDLYELLIGRPSPALGEKLGVNNHKDKSDGYVLTGKSYTVKDVVKGCLLRLGVDSVYLSDPVKKMFRPLLRALDIFEIKKIKVPDVTKGDQEILRAYLKEENLVLLKSYGVKY